MGGVYLCVDLMYIYIYIYIGVYVDRNQAAEKDAIAYERCFHMACMKVYVCRPGYPKQSTSSSLTSCVVHIDEPCDLGGKDGRTKFRWC